jgi:hypothetical protein
VVVLLAAAPVSAQSDVDAEKKACADAYDNSQVLRDEGRLWLARAQLLVCQRACRSELAADCEKWRGEVEARLPSVVLAPHDPNGTTVDARVSIDGKEAEPVPSGEVLLEPGDHTFRFENDDGEVVEATLTLAEGDKAREVEAKFSTIVPKGGVDPIAVTAIGLGAAGAIAVIAALGLTIKGHVDRNALFDCKPNCAEEDVDAVRGKWTAAGVVGALGLAAGGAGLVVWLVLGGDGGGEGGGEDAVVSPAPGGVSFRF